MTTTMEAKQTIEMAQDMGFKIWLGDTANRGWYTCQITGKKMRGQEALELLEEQKKALEFMGEKQDEETNLEAAEEQAEQEYLESEEAAEEAARENAEFSKRFGSKEGKETIFKPASIKKEDGGDVVYDFNEEDIEKGKYTQRLIDHLDTTPRGAVLTTIECQDCGTERQIKVQDKFQVTRCANCQKKHRNKRRAERRREKREAEKNQG